MVHVETQPDPPRIYPLFGSNVVKGPMPLWKEILGSSIPIWEAWDMDERTCFVRVTYRGDFFTVATAEAQVMIPDTNGKTKIVKAEGIARRSHLDKPNPDRAGEIAKGRAVKALWKKLQGKNVHNPLMA